MTTDSNPTGRQIRRAQNAAARRLEESIDDAARQMQVLYDDALRDIQQFIASLAQSDGSIAPSSLPAIEQFIRRRLQQVAEARNGLLQTSIEQGASLAINAWQAAATVVPLASAGQEAVEFVRSFIDENGLQLSDRLWRVDNAARTRITEAIESAVIQGQSASQSVRDLLGRGQPLPDDLLSKAGLAAVNRINATASDALFTGEGNPVFNAERLFRTEINRAFGESSVAAAAQHPDVAGVRFVLSPRHPRFDVCDMHASVNLHGMGPGVYPVDNHPWPAHPNTFSYLEPVFTDEITDEDRAGRESRQGFLQAQSADRQAAILRGKNKAWAFRNGHITSRSLDTPWRDIRSRLERDGVTIPDELA